MSIYRHTPCLSAFLLLRLALPDIFVEIQIPVFHKIMLLAYIANGLQSYEIKLNLFYKKGLIW